jgi:hypothetical protein
MECSKCHKEIKEPLELYTGDMICPKCKGSLIVHSRKFTASNPKGCENFALCELYYHYALCKVAGIPATDLVDKSALTPEKMIEKAISYIPEDAKMGRAFRDAVKWYNETKDPVEVRSRILENYSSENWTDVTINVSFILTALLHSKGDFDTAICTATNLGHDADCTAATVGSIVGILNPEGISEKWTAPIGDELVLSYNMINVTESAQSGIFVTR